MIYVLGKFGIVDDDWVKTVREEEYCEEEGSDKDYSFNHYSSISQIFLCIFYIFYYHHKVHIFHLLY